MISDANSFMQGVNSGLAIRQTERADIIIIPKTITENGIYNAYDDGVSGYNPVTVQIGGSEPPLPAEYQEVEYIDFTPNCGFPVTIPASFIVEGKIAGDNPTGSTAQTAFGYRLTSTAQTDFELSVASSKAQFWTRGGDYDSQYAVSVSPGDIAVVRGLAWNFRTSAFIGRYATYSANAYHGFDGKIYYIKGWDPYGSLSFKFMPCYRKADSVPGFYDVVADVFYSTLNTTGGGSIALGPDVT